MSPLSFHSNGTPRLLSFTVYNRHAIIALSHHLLPQRAESMSPRLASVTPCSPHHWPSSTQHSRWPHHTSTQSLQQPPTHPEWIQTPYAIRAFHQPLMSVFLITLLFKWVLSSPSCLLPSLPSNTSVTTAVCATEKFLNQCLWTDFKKIHELCRHDWFLRKIIWLLRKS